MSEGDSNLKRKPESGDLTVASTSAKLSKMEIEALSFRVILILKEAKIRVTPSTLDVLTKDTNSGEQDCISFPMMPQVKDISSVLEIQFSAPTNRSTLRCKFKFKKDKRRCDELLELSSAQQNFEAELFTISAEMSSILNIGIPQSNKTLEFTFTGDDQLCGKLEFQCRCNQIQINTGTEEFETPDFNIEFLQDFDRAKDLVDQLRSNAKSSAISSVTLEKGFNIPYVGRRLYEDVKSYIEQIASLWKYSNSQFYAPVVIIPQASGHGKTRLLYEFGKEHITIFLCLRQGDDSGFPLRSLLADPFDTAINRAQVDANTFFLALIVTTLKELACLQQADPEIIEELQKDVYNNSMMRRYVNLKLARIRADGKNAIITHVDDPATIEEIISTYSKERNDSQKEEIEQQVKESVTRLHQLLPQLPLPSDIGDLESLSEQLQIVDDTQVRTYARVLSIFQPWTLCDPKTSTVADEINHFSALSLQIKTYRETAKHKVRDLINKINQPIYIVLDESAYLATKKNTQQGKLCLQVISQALRDLFTAIPVVFISTSTSQSLAEFALRNEKVSASTRQVAVTRNYPPPYSRFLFLDYFADSDYHKQLREFAEQGKLNNSTSERSDDHTLYSFIKRRNPRKTIFYYGRPLWYSLRDDDSIISYAERKLSSAVDWSCINPNDLDCACVAVLAARTTFLLNYVVMLPSFSFNLIANYMATLFHINKEMTVLSYNYPSEPVLAEAAARVMSKTATLKTILDKINDLISNSTLTATGELGEFVAQLVCLRAKDEAVLNPNSKSTSIETPQSRFSNWMTVEEYLTALLGQEFVQEFSKNGSRYSHSNMTKAAAVLKKRSEFLKGLVCFNHFVKKCDDLSVKGIVYDFVGRCAAGLFINSFPQFDLFIPVLLENGRFTFILISVKNVLNTFPSNSTKLLNYDDVFPHSNHPSDIRIHKDDYCMMLTFDFGDPEANIIQHYSENEAFLVSGLRPYPSLDDELREKLSTLLNSSRFYRERFNVIAQKRVFPAMYETQREQGGDLDLQGIVIEPLMNE